MLTSLMHRGTFTILATVNITCRGRKIGMGVGVEGYFRKRQEGDFMREGI